MTTIKDVSDVLTVMDDELAQQWTHNDVIKMKLAMSYDTWLEDTGEFVTLKDHIEYYLDHPSLLTS